MGCGGVQSGGRRLEWDAMTPITNFGSGRVTGWILANQMEGKRRRVIV